jgi:Uma2 family endonuclease
MAIAESPPPLVAGDKLTLEEFLERWEAMPRLKRAELIGGIVYMPSPVSPRHGSADSFVGLWLGTYAAYTPGCYALTNTTTRLLGDAPQPDVQLRLSPEVGGEAQDEEGEASGPPELAAEVCVSRSSYDLHQKYDLYQAAGVPEYLAVLMHEKEVRWHRLVEGSYQRMPQPQDGVLRSVVFPGLWLNVQALLAGDGAQLLATLHQGLQSSEHTAFMAELARRRATTAGQ